MILLSPDGKLLGRQDMNRDILKVFPHPWAPDEKLTQHFLGFLKKAAP